MPQPDVVRYIGDWPPTLGPSHTSAGYDRISRVLLVTAEIHVLAGLNGAGKTTFARHLEAT